MKHRRAVAAIIAGGIALGMAAPAHPQTTDEAFTSAGTKLGIPFARAKVGDRYVVESC